jgi:hypothetical protein
MAGVNLRDGIMEVALEQQTERDIFSLVVFDADFGVNEERYRMTYDPVSY